MLRIKNVVALLAAVCTLAVTIGAGVATAGGDRVGAEYRAYALIRERLISCSLDRSYRHLGTEARRKCTSLRKLYVLYSDPGESYRYHVHCKTSKCPATPDGEPNARGPIPPGAQTFR